MQTISILLRKKIDRGVHHRVHPFLRACNYQFITAICHANVGAGVHDGPKRFQ